MRCTWSLLEWLDSDLTRVMVTAEAPDYRWWRKRFVKAEVERRSIDSIFADYKRWHFVIGGDRVADHDAGLASDLESHRRAKLSVRAVEAERAKLKNPWVSVEPLPPARTVKR